ncbi:hypothetical protein D4764_01G0007670 [Takifugu flavidus]|uniref:Ig-like domain-containing protein n=1 Tax=Takifugu flavidus TaxID=433684 RepID=A0A5C6PMA7_9TELE|nr:hypothetical protein D4764_01G0007670 [Takifugu flavidus]
MSLDCGRTPEYPERTHAGTGRTCKLHTESPQPQSQPGIEPRAFLLRRGEERRGEERRGEERERREEAMTQWVPPVSSRVDNHPVLGDKEVSLATCTAAGSKPPATVSWLFGDLPGDLTTISNAIEHHNGTVTTFGSLVGVPSRELDQQLVQCVVTSKATKDQTLPFTIQIYYAEKLPVVDSLSPGVLYCLWWTVPITPVSTVTGVSPFMATLGDQPPGVDVQEDEAALPLCKPTYGALVVFGRLRNSRQSQKQDNRGRTLGPSCWPGQSV